MNGLSLASLVPYSSLLQGLVFTLRENVAQQEALNLWYNFLRFILNAIPMSSCCGLKVSCVNGSKPKYLDAFQAFSFMLKCCNKLMLLFGTEYRQNSAKKCWVARSNRRSQRNFLLSPMLHPCKKMVVKRCLLFSVAQMWHTSVYSHKWSLFAIFCCLAFMGLDSDSDHVARMVRSTTAQPCSFTQICVAFCHLNVAE